MDVEVIVEKGQYTIVKQPQEKLETESLGSCVGLAGVDPEAEVMGLWIFVLPAAKILSRRTNGISPSFFAAEGIDEFLKALEEAGAERERLKLIAAGGARFLEAPTIFDLGGLNASMLRKLLKDRGLQLTGEKLGRPFPTKVWIEPSGKVFVKITGVEERSW
ncbi:MAG: chemotaxis protein CheD [Thermodesulfobacteria bacterium]|nr:chemotaxis protein CheD [Thermodesulfobacteriota bacterium]